MTGKLQWKHRRDGKPRYAYTHDVHQDSLDAIWNYVSGVFNVPLDAATSRRRFEQFVIPRQVFYYLASDLTEATWVQMAQYTGRDHTTAIHGVKTIQDLIDTDKKFAAKILDIRNGLMDFFPTGSVIDAKYMPRQNDWFFALCMG